MGVVAGEDLDGAIRRRTATHRSGGRRRPCVLAALAHLTAPSIERVCVRGGRVELRCVKISGAQNKKNHRWSGGDSQRRETTVLCLVDGGSATSGASWEWVFRPRATEDTINRRDVLHGGNLQDGVHFFGGGAGGPGSQQADRKEPQGRRHPGRQGHQVAPLGWVGRGFDKPSGCGLCARGHAATRTLSARNRARPRPCWSCLPALPKDSTPKTTSLSALDHTIPIRSYTRTTPHTSHSGLRDANASTCSTRSFPLESVAELFQIFYQK